MQSFAVIPLRLKERTKAEVFAVVASGILLLTLAAQIRIVLPWTPVPITGQTMGVTFIALSFGRKLGLATVLSYLCIGFLGFPVFASWQGGFTFGPTMGYLIGMALSTAVVGTLADRGFARTHKGALLCGFIGSLFVFGCGLSVLSFYVPLSQLLTAGLLPFIPGDIMKTTIAATIVSRLGKTP